MAKRQLKPIVVGGETIHRVVYERRGVLFSMLAPGVDEAQVRERVLSGYEVDEIISVDVERR